MNRTQLSRAQKELCLDDAQLAVAVGVALKDVACWRKIGPERKPIPLTVAKCIELLLEVHRLRNLGLTKCTKCGLKKAAYEFLKSQRHGWCRECSQEHFRNRYREKAGSQPYLQKYERRLFAAYGRGLSVVEAAVVERINRVTMYAFMNKFEDWLATMPVKETRDDNRA